MQQTAIEETEKSKLVRFVRRITGSINFPNLDSFSKIADVNQTFLEALYGVVSIAYRAGQNEAKLEEGVYTYLSKEVTNDSLRDFSKAVYEEGKKSGRLKKYTWFFYFCG